MNFSFLNPAFLWALPLAALPVIIHWLTRPRPVVFPFSAVRLLKDSLRSRLLTSRLRDLLLLALRTTLLAALLLLFSRPVLHWAGTARDPSDAAAIVLVIDASYSMSARESGVSSFESAVQSARALLESAGRGDRIGLVAFSDRVEISVPPTEDRDRIRQTLSGLAVLNRPTRVGPALSLAQEMLQADTLAQKVLFLFSDFAENDWRNFGETSGWNPAIRLVFAESSPERENAAVEDVRLSPASGKRKVQGAFAVRSWGSSAGAERDWKLFLGGTPAARGRLALSSTATRERFSAVSPAEAEEEGRLALSADALEVDDVRFFVPDLKADYSVLVINGSPSLTPLEDEAYYLLPVLRSLEEEGARTRVATLSEAGGVDLSDWDVVLLLNPPNVPASLLSKLKDHLKSGRGLWVSAGENVDSSANWADLLPGRLAGSARSAGALKPEPKSAEHPLGRALGNVADFEWKNARVEKAVSFHPANDATTLISAGSPELPLLTVGRVLGAPVAVLTTTLDREWTNLPSKPLYPVLCREILNFLSGRTLAATGSSLRVGEPFEMPAGDPSLASVRMRRPDGETDDVARRGGKIVYENTDVPGVYALERLSDGLIVVRFAVNVDVESEEGNLRRADMGKIRALFRKNALLWVGHQESVVDRYRESVRGKDLTPSLAALGLLLFSLESLLSYRWRGRRKGRGETSGNG